MQYGYFDNEKREYVITRPDTPEPWANYLGSPEYGALISNNAGGYSFVKSGANGRILRYYFNDFDQPGRYIYIRDDESKDYWSASWQPVGKPLNVYESRCRHGLGYTEIEAAYSGIETKALYYVPDGKTYEVWRLRVTNKSDRARKLTLTGFAEFTNNKNYEQDLVNLQYSRFITSTEFCDNRIIQYVHANIAGKGGSDGNDFEERFLALIGAPVSSCTGERESFLGKYRGYGNPKGIEDGELDGKMNYGGFPVAALSAKAELAPGETKTIAFILGAKSHEEQEEIIASYLGNKEGTSNGASAIDAQCDAEIDQLKALWNGRLEALQVKTPSPEFDTMINIWNAYNCYMTFIWSRAASFIYCGLRNGYGYRDTVQDIQGIIHLAPQMAREKIEFMLSAQVHHGGGLPLVKFTHNAGHEDTPEDESYVRETGHPAYRADDALWLFPTVWKYISETGDKAFLKKMILFADKDEGTVYEHLKRAIAFSENHLGPHGMPAGLHADWNDCLRLGANGESSFVAFQFYYALKIMREFAYITGDTAYADELTKRIREFGELVNGLCWDEDRYIRGFKEDGTVIGARTDKEANIWLNPQSWAVISGAADEEKAEKALETAYNRLNTAYGREVMDPPYKEEAFEGALMVIFNQGMKENAGIFSQTQGWAILADALKGHGERAFSCFMENAPSAQNDKAEIRGIEPYCYGQFTEGHRSPHHGRSHVHWLTGTASTVMVGCVEGILGLRPDPDGIRISPAIPKEWPGFEMEKTFRGKKLHIRVVNENHKESGCNAMYLNGSLVQGNYITEEELRDENEIIYHLS